MKYIGIKDLRIILNFYNNSTPNTIYKMKKKVNRIIVDQLCLSNCDKSHNYKKLLKILHKKRMISCHKKNTHGKTKKKYIMIYKQTRTRSPIRYLDT